MRLNEFLGQLKAFSKEPEITSLIISLGLLVLLFALTIFFLPFVLKFVLAVIFLSVALTILGDGLKLAKFKKDASFNANELKAVTKNMKEGVIAYDSDFKILTVNPAAEEITKLNESEILGKKITPDFMNKTGWRTLAQILFPSLAPSARELSSEGWPQIVEISTDNPSLKLHTILNRVFDDKGKTLGFLKIIRDETREKNIIESKNEFVTITSHQLRTPLTGINWAFEHLLKNLNEKPELKEIAEEGLKLGNQAVKTINDLLDVTRIESGKFGYKFEETDLTQLISEILNQANLIAKKRGIKLLFSPPSEKINAKIDAEQFGIALSNLIDNAIKYNREGGEVEISFEKLKDQPALKISVADTGVGIPKEEINKLFTKFYRGSNITQLEPNGSGLGLFIAKNIIERHGGKISVTSNQERGSIFSFTLPTTI